MNYIEVMALNQNGARCEELLINPLEKENLERDKYEAVLEERYEEAAVLRDKIKELNIQF